MESEERGRQPLIFVHGPTIRRAPGNASLVRSQLMRQQRYKRQDRINEQLTKAIDDNVQHESAAASWPACRCGTNAAIVPSKTLAAPPAGQPTRQPLPQLQPTPDLYKADLIMVMCPLCLGVRRDAVRAVPLSRTREIATCQLDPFFSGRSKAGSYFDLLLHHCVHVLWPMARPTEFSERSLKAYLDPARNPMVMQSMLYSASLHFDALPRIHGATGRLSSGTHPLRLKGSLMNQVRKKLSTLNSANMHDDWVDDILMSILYLAANENMDQIGRPEDSLLAAPFRSLQLMEFYGSCEFHPLHWQTVQHITLQKGGLMTVKLYGLAWLIAISGLLLAVNTNSKPVFPLISPDGKSMLYRAPLHALSLRLAPRHGSCRNHGFQQLALLAPPIKGSIIRVLLDLSEIVQALNILAGQPCSARLLTQIGDARASVLHRLCSLPDHTDRATAILHKRQCTAEERVRSITIYLICRRVVVLYAANVVMPLPKTSTLRREMTAIIHQQMLQFGRDRCTNTESEILLWCCTIAGICSDGSPEMMAWILEISTWEAFVEFLQSFAWLDCASDNAGKAFWREMGVSRAESEANSET
ncbi:hypothetical protein BJX65DRAFT_298712 [Aspergillus insuetus]